MPLTVRVSTDPREVDALDATNPEARVTALWRQMDAGFAEPPSRWWIAALDDVDAGYGAAVAMGVAAQGRGIGHLWVPRQHRRQGVASALRVEIEAVVRAAGLPGVLYGHDTSEPDAAAAVAAWGLAEVGRHQESVLDLQTLDVERFRERATRPGVDLQLLDDPATFDDGQWGRLHSFVAARMSEAPDAPGAEPVPPEVLRGVLGEGWVAALATRGEEWLGFTAVVVRAGSDDVVNTFFTGVSPQARGAGIASALKCFHALTLRERGLRRLFTQNMVGNEPILAANRSLGFVPDREHVDVAADF